MANRKRKPKWDAYNEGCLYIQQKTLLIYTETLTPKILKQLDSFHFLRYFDLVIFH